MRRPRVRPPVIARTSASAPERYATCERQTTAIVAPVARALDVVGRRAVDLVALEDARARRGPRARSGRSGSSSASVTSAPAFDARAPPTRACRGSRSSSRRRAPRRRLRRARRRRAGRRPRRGSSIQSGQAVTSREPHSSTQLRRPLDRALREPPERVAVGVDRPLVVDHEPLAERRERVGRGRAPRRRPAFTAAARRSPPSSPTQGSRHSKWPSSDSTSSTSSPASRARPA